MIALLLWEHNAKEVILTDKNVIYRYGVFNKNVHFIPVDKIEGIEARSHFVAIKSGSVLNQMNLNISDAHDFALAVDNVRAGKR
jgi:Bacterial PH domain